MLEERKKEFLSECKEDHIQLKKSAFKSRNIICQAEKSFDLSETVSLESDKPDIGKILFANAFAMVDSKKTVTGKMLIKGELVCDVVYCPDKGDNKMLKLRHTMPISQIIDLAGADEKSSCMLNLSVMRLMVNSKADSTGKNRLLEIAAKISALAKCSETKEFSCVLDSYSTKCELETENETVDFCVPVAEINETRTVRKSFELQKGIKEICSIKAEDISTKIKSAVDLKKMNGEYVYGNAPYGYKKGEKKNTIVIDEPAALVVRRMFRWAAMGVSISEIARRLNSDGIETPSVYLAAVRGKYKTRSAWSFESVRNILENRIYTGDTVPFKSHVVRVGSDRTKAVPLNQQVVIPNTHEPIIGRELFQRAHDARKRYAPRQYDPDRRPYEFQSVLTCGCCGNKLARGKKQNKDWLCTMRRYTPDSACADVRINDAQLLKIVTNAIQAQSRLVDIKIKKLKKAARGAKTEEQLLQAECKQLRRQLEQIQKDKMTSYECFLAGQYTKEQFLAMKKDLS
ncbi:MAG: recombinase family protein, partial [Mogibacterium sp.]|nr:recombinase family protein [Mogibacterium sp.]